MEVREKEMKEWFKDLLKQEAGSCPGEEELAGFLEDKLQGAKREETARHVYSCERCRDALAAASGPVSEKVRVPAHAFKKAVELAPIREGPWEIVVSFISDAIEVLKNTGDRTQYFGPAYATVRGPSMAPGTLVAFSRQFAGLDVEIEVERVASKTSEIKLTARSAQAGRPAKNLRVNLFRNDRELMSYVLEGGSAIFDKVPFGAYKIDFTRRGIRIGEIALEIKGE